MFVVATLSLINDRKRTVYILNCIYILKKNCIYILKKNCIYIELYIYIEKELYIY